jgi:hypothetical protein
VSQTIEKTSRSNGLTIGEAAIFAINVFLSDDADHGLSKKEIVYPAVRDLINIIYVFEITVCYTEVIHWFFYTWVTCCIK